MQCSCYGRKIPHSIPFSFFRAFIDELMLWNTLWSVGQLSWLCPFPKSCPAPASLARGMLERQTMQWSAAQQQPKLWGVSHTFLATNANHSFVRALMKKIIPTTWSGAQVPPVIAPNDSNRHFLLVPVISWPSVETNLHWPWNLQPAVLQGLTAYFKSDLFPRLLAPESHYELKHSFWGSNEAALQNSNLCIYP